ncbi:hemerythrin domain-containing protein [Simiduia sp. 21SJ11W-1]|uniref:hemerythrin domain-containing protein n=1 Tax=Simiduia sp. 21SJ11W-1 TaxID=2909669 RepID=UPI0020A22149|nr:hemerythrin domain-containing protein [Simiduia sp. 21SJ11W-1]UTA46925.1 hemerythrin domain-containing protein [Simiduia sp. 21SJ11W-1]
MFGFISDFFSGRDNNQKEAPKLAEAPKAGANTIAYDPNLIAALEADHSKLVELYGKMWDEGFEKKNYVKLTRILGEFKSLFQGHLLKENVRFYVYLEQSLGNDKHTLAVVKEFRSDMNDIANAVIGFCKRYGKGQFTPAMELQFKKDYTAIGEALTRRVQSEERDLYSLYQA